MPPIRLPLADPALRAALTADLDAVPTPRTARLAAHLARAFGPTTRAIIHYGSHAQRSDARPESAHDFFIIVERYADAYRSLAASGGTTVRPRLAALLNHVLPPNVVAVTERDVEPPLHAKCAILSVDDLRRACSRRARDHFTQGRLFQQVQLVWTSDPAARAVVVGALLEARARTFEWGRPYLPAGFDAETYCRVLLDTSYAAEIRPEGRERVVALIGAQRETVVRMYDALLQHLAAKRIVAKHGKVYTDLHPPGRWAKFRAAMYFRRSKRRATARWLKYIVLYDDWLDYILLKVARRSGVSVELTARERRWPLIFLWPKAIRYLRSRPQRRT